MTWRAVGFVCSVIPALLLPGTALATDDQIWIVVSGPNVQLPQPRPDYTLEVGGLGWQIDGKTFDSAGTPAVVSSSVSLVVRVRRLSDCSPVVSFVAKPGSNWVIRFMTGTTVRVEDWTKNGLDAGPGSMPPPGPLLCPRLPDTATALGSGHANRTPAVPVGVAGVAGLVFAWAALRRRASRRPAPLAGGHGVSRR